MPNPCSPNGKNKTRGMKMGQARPWSPHDSFVARPGNHTELSNFPWVNLLDNDLSTALFSLKASSFLLHRDEINNKLKQQCWKI